MYQQLRVTVYRESGQRRFLGALLSLATGLLALTWPNFLYYIVGGYLLVLGAILFYYKVSNFLTAVSIVTAVVIFLFPELIPFTFAFFLFVFGLIMLMSFKLSILGVISVIIGGLIITYPGSVAYMIAAFLLFYGVFQIVYLLQESRQVKV